MPAPLCFACRSAYGQQGAELFVLVGGEVHVSPAAATTGRQSPKTFPPYSPSGTDPVVNESCLHHKIPKISLDCSSDLCQSVFHKQSDNQ